MHAYEIFSPTGAISFFKSIHRFSMKVTSTCVINFRKVKRVEDVINTFLLINEKMPSKLLLLGDGPERPLQNLFAVIVQQ